MKLYFVVEDSKLRISSKPPEKRYKGVITEVEVVLKKFPNGDSVKKLLKLFEMAFNINDTIGRHIYLTYLYPKFHALDKDNEEVQSFFFDTWIKSILYISKMFSKEFKKKDEEKKSKKISIRNRRKNA